MLACVLGDVDCNEKLFAEQTYDILREEYTECSPAIIVYGDICVSEIC